MGIVGRKRLPSSRQLVFVMDAERRIVALSDGMAAAFGVAQENLIGRTCVSLMHEGGERRKTVRCIAFSSTTHSTTPRSTAMFSVRICS